MNWKSFWKKLGVVAIFLLVLILTYSTVFNNSDMSQLGSELSHIAPAYALLMAISALGYALFEGLKIWILMDRTKSLRAYFRCVGYSFIEIFYGGITPSSSGGQPIQLLYMKKDGYSFAKGCAAMSLSAALNKYVLVFGGFCMVLFGGDLLKEYFGSYLPWFILGMCLLAGWTLLLTLFTLSPNTCQKVVLKLVKPLHKLHLIKDEDKTGKLIVHFFDAYRDIIILMRREPVTIALVTIFSFLQRFCLLLVTYLVYLALGLSGTGFWTLIFLQLAIMVSADMIPLPGAQGISEYIYQHVYTTVFGAAHLTCSMVVSRGFIFYFLLFIGGIVVLIRQIFFRKKHTSLKEADAGDM